MKDIILIPDLCAEMIEYAKAYDIEQTKNNNGWYHSFANKMGLPVFYLYQLAVSNPDIFEAKEKCNAIIMVKYEKKAIELFKKV